MSSGGRRGYAIIGAVNELVRRKALDVGRLRSIIGTSVGAVIGLLLSIGYSSREILHLCFNVDSSSLIGANIGLSEVLSIPITLGAITSESSELSRTLRILVRRSRLAVHHGIVDTDELTFDYLSRHTDIDFQVCAADIQVGVPVYFCTETTPGMSLVAAVCASAAIPMVFTPVDGRYVDGGLVDPYPLHRSPHPPHETLGILLTDSPLEPVQDMPFHDYVMRLFRSVENDRLRKYVERATDHPSGRTIILECPRWSGSPISYVQIGVDGVESHLRRRASRSRVGRSRKKGSVMYTMSEQGLARLLAFIAAHRRRQGEEKNIIEVSKHQDAEVGPANATGR